MGLTSLESLWTLESSISPPSVPGGRWQWYLLWFTSNICEKGYPDPSYSDFTKVKCDSVKLKVNQREGMLKFYMNIYGKMFISIVKVKDLPMSGSWYIGQIIEH